MTTTMTCAYCKASFTHSLYCPLGQFTTSLEPMSDPYKAAFIANLEKENAMLRAENARLKKAVQEIQQSALHALRFEPSDG